MIEEKISSLFSTKKLFYKFILVLLLTQIVNNAIIFFVLNALVYNPSIPQYRLICAISQIITLIFFIILTKPSTKELGLNWQDIKKKIKYLYVVGGLFVLLLVVSSYFIMWDIRYYALMTNINFGVTTPILEELIFRGYFWTKIKEQGFSNTNTLIITSIFFGLNHLGYYFQISYATQFHPDAPSMVQIMLMKVVFTTALGFVIGLIRWKSQKVYGSIIVHSILNIVGD